MPQRPALDIQEDAQSSQLSPPDISAIILPFQSRTTPDDLRPFDRVRRLVSTRELSAIWGVPESTLRYWRCAELGPPYVKLGGRIKYDLVDVELYVRANKRNPSVRAHGG